MKILIVDNGSFHLRALKNRLSDHDIFVAKYKSNYIDTKNFDLIILSGGHKPVLWHKNYYKNELDLISNTKVPILGICLGHELIARAFKVRPKRLLRKSQGLQRIKLLGGILGPVGTKTVYESHKFVVASLPKGFLKTAVSTVGIEIMHHNNRPIFGLQFHPEVTKPVNDGIEIFNTVIRVVETGSL